MSEAKISLNGAQAATRDAFIERMLQATAGLFDIFTIYIGGRLGLYQHLAQADWLTSSELAQRSDTQERYVREWLEQQTVTGIVAVENPAASENHRRYRLPAGHAEVLVDEESLNYLAPLARLAVGAVHPIGAVLEAFKQGGGVPFEAYGPDLREGQAAINRVTFLSDLGQSWFPAIPDLHARLSADPPARVADIGMGAGWSSIGLVQAYDNIQVDGFDLDQPSVELARQNAQQAGLNGRLQFHVRDAAAPDLAGNYDLVTLFEALHDMPDPVAALRTARRLLKAEGSVIIVDERVGDEFTATGNDIEWMMYGWSVLHCLPAGMAHQPSVGTGTVMRTSTLEGYARDAGFSKVEVLPIDNFFFRVYRLYL